MEVTEIESRIILSYLTDLLPAAGDEDDPDPLECPFCGSRCVEPVQDECGMGYVACGTCHARGPASEIYNTTIDRWNATKNTADRGLAGEITQRPC